MILTAQGRFLLLTGLGLLLLSLLTACTPRVFGIPEERWQQLTEEQRLEAIRGYNERELLRQQQSLARQQQAAADAKRRAIEEEREAQRQQMPKGGPLRRNGRPSDSRRGWRPSMLARVPSPVTSSASP